MKNKIEIPQDTLKYIDDEWIKGNFVGLNLIECDYNCFALNAESIKSPILKAYVTKYVQSKKMRGKTASFSDCQHTVVCKVDETSALTLGEIYLKPISNYEKKFINFFTTGSVVIPNAEFDCDDDVWKFFEKIYSFCQNKKVYVLGRYFKTSKDVFPVLAKYGGALTVCILVNSRYPLSNFPYAEIKRQMKGKGFTIKSTSRSSELHQREIVLQKIIVNFDNDFSNANLKDTTWQMSVTLSEKSFKQKELFVYKAKTETITTP